ncbi:hypothetical protein MKK75_06185 [Methylobacterium sp. J-030]|uniref:hypothetical protein n=1 Tax=Methylobacterium sp. J-030 TaxID=2836627 RepID=UPI001FB98FA1|nr:hypothetical protein [Methylobacterium sp. J-030]MCJ2068401.1 hypothetical protein [Methylobacterium sp. J-030]
MSSHPAFNAVDSMEGDIRDLGRWAMLLNRLGTTETPIEPEEIYVISIVLLDMARRLDTRRTEAFSKVGGRA